MSRDKTRTAVTSVGKQPIRDEIRSPGVAQALAQEIVNTIGEDNLVDIKFLISPSSATREEILGAALKWVKSAEEKFAKAELLPL
jgi:hypothetical protein